MNTRLVFLVVNLFFLSILIDANSTSLHAQELFDSELEKMADDYVKKRANKGLVVVVVNGNHSEAKGFGRISRQNEQVPNEHTLFEIGAVTNVFTTSLMMLESQNGSFQLEDPIQEYLPEGVVLQGYQEMICEPEGPPNRIDHDGISIFDPICRPTPFLPIDYTTFCDLASHTSGLPNSPHGLYSWNPFRLAKQMKDPFKDYSKEELYDKLSTYMLGYAPGTYFSYSGLGIGLLGNVVADISALPYDVLLSERLLEPLLMEDTGFSSPAIDIDRLAQGHNKRGKAVESWHFDALAPSGGLVSSGADMLSFLEANLDNSPGVFTDAFDQVHQARVETKSLHNRPSSIGYGWMVTNLSATSNLPMTWHSGVTGGYASFIGFTKDTGVGVVILSNSSRSVSEMGFEMLELLNVKPVKTGTDVMEDSSPVIEGSF